MAFEVVRYFTIFTAYLGFGEMSSMAKHQILILFSSPSSTDIDSYSGGFMKALSPRVTPSKVKLVAYLEESRSCVRSDSSSILMWDNVRFENLMCS